MYYKLGEGKGIAFNAQWAAGLTLEKFTEHEAHHGLTPDQYKEAHDLCIKEVTPVTEAKATEEVVTGKTSKPLTGKAAKEEEPK